VTPAAARESALEQAARALTLANAGWFPSRLRDEAEDIAANLVTVANEIR